MDEPRYCLIRILLLRVSCVVIGSCLFLMCAGHPGLDAGEQNKSGEISPNEQFEVLLKKTGMSFSLPAGFSVIETPSSEAFSAQKAIRSDSGRLEIWYRIVPSGDSKGADVNFDDESYLATAMTSVIMNLNGGSLEFSMNTFKPNDVAEEFFANWGATATFDTKSGLPRKTGMCVAIHRNEVATAYIISFFDNYLEQETMGESMNAFHALKFAVDPLGGNEDSSLACPSNGEAPSSIVAKNYAPSLMKQEEIKGEGVCVQTVLLRGAEPTETVRNPKIDPQNLKVGYLMSERGGNWLRMIGVNGYLDEQIVSVDSIMAAFTWSPDGKLIAFERASNDSKTGHFLSVIDLENRKVVDLYLKLSKTTPLGGGFSGSTDHQFPGFAS